MKVSLYFDGDVWSRFKRRVLQRTGDLKGLSREVQALVRDSLVDEALRSGFEKMSIDTKAISSTQIEAVIPSVPTSSAKTIREMRRGRLGKGVP